MSIFSLPKEIRLQIWSLAYLDEPPRLVRLITGPHDEHHEEVVFCPRFSSTRPPIAAEVCRESRAEVEYQARRAGHLIHLPSPFNPDSSGFHFRLDTDILFIDVEYGTSKHLDDTPDCGLLAHFLEAKGCDARLLKKIAITQIVHNAFIDGAMSNCLRDLPHIEHLIMLVDWKDMRTEPERERFVLAARRIITQYRLDMRIRAKVREEVYVHSERGLDLDFAVRKDAGLELLDKEVWSEWGDLQREWWKEDVPQRYIDFYF